MIWKLIAVSSSKNTYIGHWNQINFVFKVNISNAIVKKYATQVKKLVRFLVLVTTMVTKVDHSNHRSNDRSNHRGYYDGYYDRY